MDKEPLNREYAKKDLLDIKKVLDDMGVKFFLSYGTALGAYRDKDFIEYDDDIDLIITQKLSLKEHKKIGWALLDIGFKRQDQVMFNVFGRFEQVGEGYDGTNETGIIVCERYVPVTIFFFSGDDKMVCIPKLGSFPILETEAKFFKQGEKIKFLKEEFLIPSPIEEYLEYTYNDWKTPIKEKHAKQYSETHDKEYLKKWYGLE